MTPADSLTLARAIKRALPELKGKPAELIAPVIPEILAAARVVIRSRLKNPSPAPVVLMGGGVEERALV